MAPIGGDGEGRGTVTKATHTLTNGLFGCLFVMSKAHAHGPAWRTTAAIAIRFAQMFAFVIAEVRAGAAAGRCVCVRVRRQPVVSYSRRHDLPLASYSATGAYCMPLALAIPCNPTSSLHHTAHPWCARASLLPAAPVRRR